MEQDHHLPVFFTIICHKMCTSMATVAVQSFISAPQQIPKITQVCFSYFLFKLVNYPFGFFIHDKPKTSHILDFIFWLDFCKKKKFKIGICQLKVSTEKSANIFSARNLIQSAAEQGATLILLPVSSLSLH